MILKNEGDNIVFVGAWTCAMESMCDESSKLILSISKRLWVKFCALLLLEFKEYEVIIWMYVESIKV